MAHHIAIMNKKLDFIAKILRSEKTIESRWYSSKRAPWDRVTAGDTIYFKNSGEDVIASANVARVLQFKFTTYSEAEDVFVNHYREIGFNSPDPALSMPHKFNNQYQTFPRYCILMVLSNPKAVSPAIKVNKKGFGNAAAWLTINNNEKINYPTQSIEVFGE